MADFSNPWLPPQQMPQQQPAVTDTAEPNLQQKWQSWMQNPVNRNGLMAFGTQLMMGSWGSPVASALSAGIESAAGTEQVLKADALNAQTRADRLGEADTERGFKAGENEKDRAAALERAKLVSNTRLQTAGSRGNNSAFNTAYRAKYQALQIPLLSGDITQEEAEQLALSAGEAAAAAAPIGYNSQGNAPAPGQGAPTNGVPGAAGTVPPGPQTGASGAPGASSGKAPYDYNELKKKYGASWGENFDSRVQAFEAAGHKITGKPVSKGAVPKDPSFKGTADGTAKAPFPTRQQAVQQGWGSYYKDANGKLKMYSIIGDMDREPAK